MTQELTQPYKCFYRVSLKAVIFNERGQVLVVREKNNSSWNLPGGGMDYGETEREALARELCEEVGYTGSFSYAPLGIHPMHLATKQAWQLWIVYRISPESFDFTIGEEADKIAWMDPEEFRDYHVPIRQFCELARQL